MKIAITGGTGFVGSRVVGLADHPVSALARKTQPEQPHVEWIAGSLTDPAALARMCDGADAVIHIAGVVNAPNRAGFEAGNVAGTAAVLTAAKVAGAKRFVHVSSLSAREPRKSMYGGSKARGDALVAESGLDWVIVRPPAVYGSGDTEMVDLYRLAARGYAAALPGRISVIHVDDLATALLALTGEGPSHEILEIDDGRGDATDGYSHMDFARAIGAALGREALMPLLVPAGVLGLAAGVMGLAGRITGKAPKLTRDRARYIAHPDWVARGGNARLSGLWTPRFDLSAGVADTVGGYRAKGWL